MRRVVMWNLVTLGGLFEGPNRRDLDGHEEVWGDELEQFSMEQMKSADMLLFGRFTYQGMAVHPPTATGEVADIMNRIPRVVFSKTLNAAEWSNTKLMKTDAAAEVLRYEPLAARD